MQIAEKFQSHGPTSNPKSSFQPFNLPFLLSRKNLPPPPRSGDTMRGRKGGHLADEAETRETHRLGNSPGLSSFPPTYPDIPSQFLTVNQPSSTSSTVFPEVVWRRNKSCRFTERGGGKERERKIIVGKQFSEKRSFAIIIIPSAAPPTLAGMARVAGGNSRNIRTRIVRKFEEFLRSADTCLPSFGNTLERV